MDKETLKTYPLSGRARFKPRSAVLISVPTGKNFRSWQAGGADDSSLVDLLAVVPICWLLSTAFKTSPRLTFSWI